MKKQIFSALVALFAAVSTDYAQVEITVIDKETKEVIPFHSIYYLDYQFGQVANEKGIIYLSEDVKLPVHIRISASGYQSVYRFIEESGSMQFELEINHIEIEEVSVSMHRNSLRSNNPTHIESRTMDELSEIPSTRVADALRQMPGVYTSNTGAGVSKPVVRGFQGVRILTLLNGVRLENQQWGGDHDFGITDLGIGRVEVIKGPASLLYGADALGGVIYLADEDYAQQNHFSLRYTSVFSTNTMGTKNNLSVKFAKKNVRMNFHGNFSSHADYQLPDGDYVHNSRFNGYSAKYALGVNKGSWVMHLRYAFAKSDVGIIGGHNDEDEGVIEDEHALESEVQERSIEVPFQRYENHLLSLRNKFFGKKSEWMVLLAHSYNRLSEMEESFNEAAMQLDLNNSTYQIQYKRKLFKKAELMLGVQGGYQMNLNRGEELLIPDFWQWDNGVYLLYLQYMNKWTIQAGARYDVRRLETNEISIPNSYMNTFGRPNFSLGTVYSGDNNTVKFNLASGFRVPHLSELLADGEHHGALRYEIGNRNLQPEQMYQLDITDEVHGDHFELVINPFFSYARNYIYLQALDSIVDELPVYMYEQKPSAILFGGDIATHYHPHFAHWLHWEPTFSFIYAQDEKGAALPMIPQARIVNNFRFDFTMKSKFRIRNVIINYAYYFDQFRVTDLETPSKGYNIIDLALNMGYYTERMPIEIGIGVRNLFNESYIDHLSRLKTSNLANPGRNIFVRLVVKLDGKLEKN